MNWTHLVPLLFVGLSSTLCVVAPAVPVELVGGLRDSFDTLAARWPHINTDEVNNVGKVPEDLHQLITSASPDGRLTITAPPPGHFLLLTRPKDATKSTVMGILTTPSGEQRYFRTPPVPNANIPRLTESYQGSSPPLESAFPPRQLTIDLGNGNLYRPAGQFSLDHASVIPLNIQENGGKVIYGPGLLNSIVDGRSGKALQWSETPNWSAAEGQEKALASPIRTMKDGLNNVQSPQWWKQTAQTKYNGAKELYSSARSAMQTRWRDRRYKSVQDLSNALREKWNQRTYKTPTDLYNAARDRWNQRTIRTPQDVFAAVRARFQKPPEPEVFHDASTDSIPLDRIEDNRPEWRRKLSAVRARLGALRERLRTPKSEDGAAKTDSAAPPSSVDEASNDPVWEQIRSGPLRQAATEPQIPPAAVERTLSFPATPLSSQRRPQAFGRTNSF